MVEPIVIALKFVFLILLYLFLAWVTLSAIRDLRQARGAAETADAAPLSPRSLSDQRRSQREDEAKRSSLTVVKGAKIAPGTRYRVRGGLTIGRSPDADITVHDDFASGMHARVFSHKGEFYVEDLGSTNGTFLNDRRIRQDERLRPRDRVRIGDTEFRYEE